MPAPRRRTSTRCGIDVFSLVGLLALGACGQGSQSSSSSELVVRSISVPDFGSWEANRPIEFAFNQPIDLASVSDRSIHIRTSAGVPAVGTFAAKTIEEDQDERTDE